MSIIFIALLLVSFAVGLALIPILVSAKVLPSFVGDRIGNGLLSLTAMARGGNRIELLRTGNYEIGDFEELEPKKNHDQLHGKRFCVTYEKDEGVFSAPVVADNDPAQTGSKVEADGGELAIVNRPGDQGKPQYADLSEVGKSGGIWVILNTYMRQFRNLGTTETIEQAQEEAKEEHGGDTKGLDEKMRVIAVFGALIMGSVVGFIMFGGAF